MKNLFQKLFKPAHKEAKAPAQEALYAFLDPQLRERAKKVHISFNLNTEDRHEHHMGCAITLEPKEDGFIVRDMLEENSEKLSQAEALEKVTRIVARVEEEYRNRPSEEEYLRQLMEQMAFPPEFSELPNEPLENYIRSMEARYDDTSGSAGIIYVKMEDTPEAVIDAILRYRKTVQAVFRLMRSSWLTKEGDAAIRQHWCKYGCQPHRWLIQAECLPELSTQARQLCRQNGITFGTMKGLGYRDLLEGADFVLENETGYGAVDDAATILCWKWVNAGQEKPDAE